MKQISVCSVVVDPFAGAEDAPFVTGYYDGKVMAVWWGPSCVASLAEHIKKQPGARIIYYRDGGRSDFYYLLPWIERSELSIVAGRVLKAHIGSHQLRDSWGIMPFPLRQTPHDYSVYHSDLREYARDEITNNLTADLTGEFILCSRFNDEFGQFLTIGAVSAREIARHCPFWRGKDAYDLTWRDRFYFGGRNELFVSGIILGDIRAYDISSAFPSVMREFRHPTGTNVTVTNKIDDRTFFVSCTGRNFGAFPIRNLDTQALTFSRPEGTFHVSRHEFDAAIDTGSFECDKIIAAYSWERSASFEAFVDPLYAKRLKAKREGDYWGSEIYKFVLNGAYGKFGQNPARYSDYYLTRYGYRPPVKGFWVPSFIHEGPTRYMLWQKPASHPVWFNIATAASITGAARAKLLRGIAATPKILYCDTDSIISQGPAALELGDGIGKWKLEHTATAAAFVRKKIYALFDGTVTVGNSGVSYDKCVKIAHSGCILSVEEILRAAQGERIVKIDMAPTFDLSPRSPRSASDAHISFRKHTVTRS